MLEKIRQILVAKREKLTNTSFFEVEEDGEHTEESYDRKERDQRNRDMTGEREL